MNLFGWIIRQVFNESGPQPRYEYLSSIRLPDEGEKAVFGFSTSCHNAELLNSEFKDGLLEQLRGQWPASKFEARELFW